MDAFENRKLNIKSILLIAISVIFCVAVCVLLFCLNITKAVALEQEIRCDIEEHIHMDSCYDGDFLICKKPAHSHDGNCYIVLLNENDINGILTLLGNNETRSLEYVITDTMSSALTFNSNLNSVETDSGGMMMLSQDTVAELNNTISDEEELPNIVLNENINTVSTLALDDTTTNEKQNNSGATTLSVGDEPDTSKNKANFYIYLDRKWTCIGSCDFTVYSQSSGWITYYYSRVPNEDMLELINTTLGTDFTYSSFSLSVSSSQNSGYTTRNVSVGSTTTTLSRSTSNSTANSVKYVRLIPSGANQNSTAFSFYTVKYIYPDTSEVTTYVRAGKAVVLPSGNYEWSDGDNTYSAGEAVTIPKATTFTASTLGPITDISINYDVNFPSVSGVTVTTTPTIAGHATTTLKDEYSKNSVATIRNVSQQSVQGTVNNNGTGLTRVIQFKGWKVGNTDVVLQPNTKLIWEELIQYSGNTTS